MFQAILKGSYFPPGPSWPRDRTWVFCIATLFSVWSNQEAQCMIFAKYKLIIVHTKSNLMSTFQRKLPIYISCISFFRLFMSFMWWYSIHVCMKTWNWARPCVVTTRWPKAFLCPSFLFVRTSCLHLLVTFLRLEGRFCYQFEGQRRQKQKVKGQAIIVQDAGRVFVSL